MFVFASAVGAGAAAGAAACSAGRLQPIAARQRNVLKATEPNLYCMLFDSLRPRAAPCYINRVHVPTNTQLRHSPPTHTMVGLASTGHDGACVPDREPLFRGDESGKLARFTPVPCGHADFALRAALEHPALARFA